MGYKRPELPDGCHLHDHCLTCPLPECIYENEDEPTAVTIRRLQDEQRVETIEQEELTTLEAANRFGVTERTVYRMMERIRIRRMERDRRLNRRAYQQAGGAKSATQTRTED